MSTLIGINNWYKTSVNYFWQMVTWFYWEKYRANMKDVPLINGESGEFFGIVGDLQLKHDGETCKNCIKQHYAMM